MIGSQIHQYKIIEKLGAGGMGEVYLAEDTKLDRKVALKFLPPQISSDPDFKSRFEHEAKATAALNHPNIVTVHDLGEHEGRMFIAMEHLTGQSLQDIINAGANEGDIKLSKALDVVAQVSEGLAAAHKAGVVHRDIKPANIIVTEEGRAKLLDFGLAKSHRATTETKVGSTIGTVQYESPEQSRGEESDARSDIFSLGVVLYELVTGRLPFSGEYEAQIRYAISHEEPEPLARFSSSCPIELQRVIDKALAKEPAERYQTVADMLVDIRRAKRDTQPSDRSTVTQAQTKRRLTPIIAGIALVIVTVGAYLWLQPEEKTRSSIQQEQHANRIKIAVLPFENLGDVDDEYFADGVTDEITSRVQLLPNLGVIARTSILQYKGTTKRVKEIGEELGVDYVLQGTIRWDKSSGVSRVRITPQLIRVSDETHVWADNIQKNLSQIFEVQEDIATQIAGALKLTFRDADISKLTAVPTNDIEAYDHYLRGRSWTGRKFHSDAYDSALIYFNRAIEIDPMYAEAYAWKAATHIWRSFFHATGKDFHAKQGLATIEQAFAVQPGLPEAIMAEGMYFGLITREYDSALARYDLIKDNVRERAMALKDIAVVRMRQGEWELAKEAFAESLELDPKSSSTLMLAVYLYDFLRDYDRALELNDELIKADIFDAYGHYERAMLHIKRNSDFQSAYRSLDRIPEGLSLKKLLTDGYMYYDFLGASPVRFGLVGLTESERDAVIADLLDENDPLEAMLQRSMVGDLYVYSGDSAMAQIHYDTAIMLAEPILDNYEPKGSKDEIVPDHHIRGWAALLYARAGYFDKGLEQGALSIKLMPIDLCHW